MDVVPVKIVPRGFAETERRDWWWITPLFVFLGLGGFVVYATWAAFQNAHYTWGPYLSPFYAPEIWGASPHAWFGPKPAWWPYLAPFSPALIILPFPGLFRITCYYYRGAYYKAFWLDPASCAVGEPRSTYWGERWFPLILQNVHRYFAYIALIFLVLLAWDVWLALWWPDPATGGVKFGLGVGTIILAINVVLLSCYTFGCHSLRHVFGGRRDTLTTLGGARLACYNCSSSLNARHQLFAWLSLFTVAFCDVYVRLCSMGIWHDLRIL